MKKLIYFAYGSNLLSRRLEGRIGHTEYLGNYKLKDYVLTFDCGGFANIQPSKGSYVDGALYTLDPEQLSELNRYEGLYNAEFFDYNKDTLCVVYIGKEHVVRRSKSINALPAREYLDVIMAGAIEKRLGNLYTSVDEVKKQLPPPRIFQRTKKKKVRRR